MIPHEADDPQAAGGRLPLVIFDAPHSMIAEQFRQVRTRLQHAALAGHHPQILVTSPSPGDGKTHGRVQPRRGPGPQRPAHPAGRRQLPPAGAAHASSASATSRVQRRAERTSSSSTDAVRETEVPNLSVLPTGPKPANPTELLESQFLIDFIERALEEYDHVIFDSGPLLMVSETVALAPRVDGVVTVVRARGNSRGLLSACGTSSGSSRPSTSASSSTPSAPRAAGTTAGTSRRTTPTRTR